MADDRAAADPVGYFYSGESDALLEPVYADLQDSDGLGIADRLALAGFVLSPELSAGGAPSLHVYARSPSALQVSAVRIVHGGREARFAIVLRHRTWLSPPVFVADLPTLAEFEAAVGPLLRLLGRR